MLPKKTPSKKSSKVSNKIIVLVVAILILISAIIYIYSVRQEEQLRSLSPMKKIEFKKEGELSFISSNGEFKTKIDIELADTDIKRARGLMFRTELQEDQGMLFIFDRESIQSFWMKNTPISLDMFFVNSNNVIVSISENTQPYSEEHYVSTEPAQYVVETIAGFAQKHNIKPGDKIVWRRIF